MLCNVHAFLHKVRRDDILTLVLLLYEAYGTLIACIKLNYLNQHSQGPNI